MESAIDKQLRDQFVLPSSKVRISIAAILPERVFNKLRTMYTQCGWDVIQNTSGGDDPRGTCPVIHYLEFSKARDNHSSRDFRDDPSESFYNK